MLQPSLFESGTRLLVDDERGVVTYIPGLIDPGTAARWFEELRGGVEWRSERRLMYQREVDVPGADGPRSARRAACLDSGRHP